MLFRSRPSTSSTTPATAASARDGASVSFASKSNGCSSAQIQPAPSFTCPGKPTERTNLVCYRPHGATKLDVVLASEQASTTSSLVAAVVPRSAEAFYGTERQGRQRDTQRTSLFREGSAARGPP